MRRLLLIADRIVARNRLDYEHSGDDLVQHLLLKITQGQQLPPAGDSVEDWFVRKLRNHVRGLRRKGHHTQRGQEPFRAASSDEESSTDSDPIQTDHADPTADPLRSVLASDMLHRLRTYLQPIDSGLVKLLDICTYCMGASSGFASDYRWDHSAICDRLNVEIPTARLLVGRFNRHVRKFLELHSVPPHFH